MGFYISRTNELEKEIKSLSLSIEQYRAKIAERDIKLLTGQKQAASAKHENDKLRQTLHQMDESLKEITGKLEETSEELNDARGEAMTYKKQVQYRYDSFSESCLQLL